MVYDFSKELMHWDQKLFALTYRYYLVHEYPFEFRIDCSWEYEKQFRETLHMDWRMI